LLNGAAMRAVTIAGGAMSFLACVSGDEPLVASADEPLPAELSEGDVVYKGDIAIEVPPIRIDPSEPDDEHGDDELLERRALARPRRRSRASSALLTERSRGSRVPTLHRRAQFGTMVA
jgi:hypothetical protein